MKMPTFVMKMQKGIKKSLLNTCDKLKYERKYKHFSMCPRSLTPILCSNLLYENGREFLDRQYPDGWIRLFSVIQFADWTDHTSDIKIENRIALILDGRSEHGAHTWSKSGISICWMHLVTSTVVKSESPVLLHTCATCS